MAEDLSSTASPVKVTWSGEAGEMGAQVATPLAVALNELLQNAVEHAFVAHSDELQPEVHVLFDRQGDELSVQVKDNGSGLPADFSIDKTTSLGLSIVRGLVKSQLGGKIRMYNSGGTVVELVVPVSRAESSDLARI
jgi:two-component sensor histidine kinase